jgi:hypothetical protein
MKEAELMRGRMSLVAVPTVLAGMLWLTGPARADDVNIQVTPQPAPPPAVVQPAPSQGGATVIVPTPPTVVVPSAPQTVVVPQSPQTLQADGIEARQVQAHTIYANRIEASEVRGNVHQTTGVKIEGTAISRRRWSRPR